MITNYVEIVDHMSELKRPVLILRVKKTGEQWWLFGEQAKRAAARMYAEVRNLHP